MSREIKFRAWGKKFRTLLLPEEWAMPMIRPDGSLHDDYGYPLENDDYIIEQYTGLKDKNGIEIYEGDIVEWEVRRNSKMTFSGVAEWDKEFGCFIVGRGACEDFAHYDAGKFEVIGNIHENPELAKPYLSEYDDGLLKIIGGEE